MRTVLATTVHEFLLFVLPNTMTMVAVIGVILLREVMSDTMTMVAVMVGREVMSAMVLLLLSPRRTRLSHAFDADAQSRRRPIVGSPWCVLRVKQQDE
jgi:hypothetical protein